MARGRLLGKTMDELEHAFLKEQELTQDLHKKLEACLRHRGSPDVTQPPARGPKLGKTMDELEAAFLKEQAKTQDLEKKLHDCLLGHGLPDGKTLDDLKKELAKAKADRDAAEAARNEAEAERDKALRRAEEYRRQAESAERALRDAKARAQRSIIVTTITASFTTLVLAIIFSKPLSEKFHG